jgi:hypothetical protein
MHESRFPEFDASERECSWSELGDAIRRLAGELVDEIAADPKTLTIALVVLGGSAGPEVDDDDCDDAFDVDPFDFGTSWN